MKKNNELQALSNFATNLTLEVRELLYDDKRKKAKYYLLKNGASIGPPLDFSHMNTFMLGISKGRTHKINLT